MKLTKIGILPVNVLGFKLAAALTILLFAFFALTMYIYLHWHSEELQKNVLDHAIQVSNLIKASTRYSMLRNHRDEIANIVANVGREPGVEGVWIYNKEGVIEFTSAPGELGGKVGKQAEQCIFCHRSDEARGTIPVENRHRFLEGRSGERVLGLINPIENEPACMTMGCHAHKPGESVLGLLDVKISLREVDASIAGTRRKLLAGSGALAILTALLFWGLVHRLIHRPISRLIEGTRQVARMNLDYSMRVDSKDELGILASSFNRMTAELKRAQQHAILVEKMASLGKISAMVAHQLNNPMSGILTYAKVSLRNLEGEATPDKVSDTRENLKVMSDEAKRCGEIVNNLLIFARSPGGKKGECDANVIVQRAADILRHTFQMRNVALNLDLAKGEVRLLCDRDAVQQMLVEMMINALEAVIPRPGSVTVSTEVLADPPRVGIRILDTGHGIPADALPRIFEPFYTTKDSEKSTGLGLSVAYNVAERHGGTISVKPRDGGGTAFTIELPVKPKDEAAEAN